MSSEIAAGGQRESATPAPSSTPSSSSSSTGSVQMRRALSGKPFDVQMAMLTPVQRNGGGENTDAVHHHAAAGIASGGGALPHGDKIQQAFGGHDIGGVQAHTGAAASDASKAMGASAYASGNHIAFDGAPDLHTAAHEAAHVVQQQAGVSLSGGVGQSGDKYEQHADAVADAVVQGKSAEGLLGQMTGGSAVQKKAVQQDAVQRDATTNPDAHVEDPLAAADMPDINDLKNSLAANPTGHPTWQYFEARVREFAPHVDALAAWTRIIQQYVQALPAAAMNLTRASPLADKQNVWATALNAPIADLQTGALKPDDYLFADVVRDMFQQSDFGQVAGTTGFALWSGGVPAQQYAVKKGYTTLESSVAGQVFDKLKFLDDPSSWNVTAALWQQLSMRYAETVKGEVHCFQYSMGDVFTNFESKIVEARNAMPVSPNITFKYHPLVSNRHPGFYKSVDEINQFGGPVGTIGDWQAAKADFEARHAAYAAKPQTDLDADLTAKGVAKGPGWDVNRCAIELVAKDSGKLVDPIFVAP